ncbi:MAG: leucine-rich repeat domain-containing protein [Lachnospiraceae bacterium]|nr:leucine-rich repeat domain-containing protein [Lachnospiraceae bacterium]
MRNKLFKDFAAIMAAAVLFSNSAVLSYAGEVVLDDEVAETGKIGDSELEEASSTIIDEGDIGNSDDDDVHYTLTSDGTFTISGSGKLDGSEFGKDEYEYYDQIKKVVINMTRHSESHGHTPKIHNHMFAGCENLEELYVAAPNCIETFGKLSFANCRKLKKVTIPDTAVISGETRYGSEFDPGVFYNCTSLTDVNLGYGNWHLGRKDFQNCTSLKTIKVAPDLHHAAGSIFQGAYNLESIGVDYYKYQYYKSYNDCLVEVKIPDSYARRGMYNEIAPAIAAVPNMKVKNNDGVYTSLAGAKMISHGALNGCDQSLKEFHIANGTQRLGMEVSNRCQSLNALYIPSSVTEIGQCAFAGIPTESADDDDYDDDDDEEDPYADYNDDEDSSLTVDVDEDYDGFEVIIRGLNRSKITDVYYGGSEEEWKTIKFQLYEAYVQGREASDVVAATGTVYDHLSFVGIPDSAEIHYNCSNLMTDGEECELPSSSMTGVNKSREITSSGGIVNNITFESNMAFQGGKTVPSYVKLNGVTVFENGKVQKNAQVSDNIVIKSVKFKNNKGAYLVDDSKYQFKPGKVPKIVIKLKATNAEQKAAVKAANKALKTDTSFEYEIEPVDVNLIQNLVSAGESSYSLAKKGKNKVRYTFPVYKNGIATGKTKSKNLGKKDVSLSGTTYTFTRNFKGTIEADKLN